MAFEHLCRGIVRSSAHDHENGQLIGNVRHAVSRRALGFAKWSALVDDGVLMLLSPGFPGGEASLFFRASFVLMLAPFLQKPAENLYQFPTLRNHNATGRFTIAASDRLTIQRECTI